MDASTALVASMDTRADELDSQRLSRWHRTVVALLGLGGFLVVYAMFLGRCVSAAVTTRWALDPAGQHLVTGAGFMGMAAGALLMGTVADLWGRRRIFLINVAAFSIFSVAAAFAQGLAGLVTFQIAAGFALGAQLPLTAAFVSEIAPRRVRGRLLCCVYGSAFFAAPIMGFLGWRYVATGHWIVDGWRWLLLIGGLIGLLQLRLRRSLPESPRWELRQTRPEVLSIFDHPPEPPWRAVLAWRNRNRTFMLITAHALHAAVYGGFAVIGPLVLMSKGFSVVASVSFFAITVLGLPVGAALAGLVIDQQERKTSVIAFGLCVALFGAVFSTAANSGLIRGAGFLLAVSCGAFACALHTYQAEVFSTSIRVTGSSVGYAFFLAGLGVLPFVAQPLLNAVGSTPIFIGSAALVAVLCVVVSVVGPPSTGRSLDRI
jgi:putative MFS transporter